MPYTANKGWLVPTVSGSSDTWGDELNAAFADVDTNLGGFVSVALSSAPVTLSEAQTNNAVIRFTGTLSANITITLTPPTGGPTNACGFWFIENATTGAFTVSLTNGVGSAVAVSQGNTSLVVADATNGCRSASMGSIPAGAVTVFFNSATSPLGWTKLTTHDNALMRIVSGTPGTGGTKNFSDVLNASITNNAQHSHGVTDGGHTHTYTKRIGSQGYGEGYPYVLTSANSTDDTGPSVTNITINNAGSGNTTAFDIKYVDAILCQKN